MMRMHPCVLLEEHFKSTGNQVEHCMPLRMNPVLANTGSELTLFSHLRW